MGDFGRRVVARNAEGRIVGETHHRAKIPDAVVRQLRDLHENECLTLRDLAERFRLNYWSVVNICCYKRRVSVAVRFEKADPERDGEGRRMR